MFDPTIYDNLKTVLEGEVYDRDMAGHLVITKRSDTLDLAVMSRTFLLRFHLIDTDNRSAEITLSATAADLAGEIAETKEEGIGCRLNITFVTELSAEFGLAKEHGEQMRKKLAVLWEDGVTIDRKLAVTFPETDTVPVFECRSSVEFLRKITEKQITDIPRLIDSVLQTLEQL